MIKQYFLNKRIKGYIVNGDRPKPPTPKREFSLKSTSWHALYVKPVLATIAHKLGFVNRMPFVAVFVIFMGFLFLSGALYNKLTFDRWADSVQQAHPELLDIPEGAIFSPLDVVFSEFVATKQGEFLVYFHLIVGMFMLSIWRTYNPRKCQSIHLRM